MATKRANRLEQYKTAVGLARDRANASIKKAEDALFAEADRLARRSQDQAASRDRSGFGGR